MNKSDQTEKGTVPADQGKIEPAQAAPGPQQGTAAPGVYVTHDDLVKFQEDTLRRLQGFVDKTQLNLQKKVTAQLSQLEQSIKLQRDAGIDITPQQEAHLRQTVINKALTEDSKEEEPHQAQPSGKPTGAEPSDPFTVEAERMMQAAGVWLDDDDPEITGGMIDDTSPYSFLDSVQKAIAAKRERLAKNAEQNATKQTPGLTGGGGAPGTYEGRKGMELLSEYYKSKG